MKKLVVAVIAAMMIVMLALPVSSVADGPDFGSVPKTADTIAIDGTRDAIYDQGLKLSIDKMLDSSQEPQGGGGTAWLLWDDEAIYVFAEVTVKEFYDSGDNAETAVSTPWDLDDVEFLVDFTNEGEVPVQYRINLDAFPNVTLPGEEWLNGEDCKPYLDYAGTKSGLTYTCEYKVKFAQLISEKVIADDVKAGKQVGVNMMVTDAYDGGQTNYMLIEELGPWNTEGFGWVTLSDTVVGGTPAEAPETEEETAAYEQPETPDAAAEIMPISEPESEPEVPQTGDGTVALVLVLVCSVAAIAVLGKKAKK